MNSTIKAGDRVKVGKAVGSKLEGKTVTVLSGPYKVGYVSGVYTVRDEQTGCEEEIHGDRLATIGK